MPLCPNGHDSASDDFCSVCGVEVAGGSAAPAVLALGTCPACATPRESARQAFCEACGHDLRTAPPAKVVAPVSPTVAPVGGGSEVRWDLVVTVDPKLYGRVDPDAPVGEPERHFTLFDAESAVGRLDPDVRVQVPVRNDPGVSRRHAVLTRRADGTVSVRDLGSANGTAVNGVELPPGGEYPLSDGDSLGVGGWTRITLRAVR
jgi:hypothetical protein